jgi:hypothetical protein
MTPPNALKAKFIKWFVEAIVGPVPAVAYPCEPDAADNGFSGPGATSPGVDALVEMRRNDIRLTVLEVASPPMKTSVIRRVEVAAVRTA